MSAPPTPGRGESPAVVDSQQPRPGKPPMTVRVLLNTIPAFFDHPDRACKGVNPDTFFPDGRLSTNNRVAERAKRICDGCRFRIECREYAIADKSLVGIWGATSTKQRQKIRKRRA